MHTTPTLSLLLLLPTLSLAASPIITGTDTGSTHVKQFNGQSLAEERSFFAYTPSFTGGVRVAAGDINSDASPDIITGAGPGGGPHVKVFDGATNAELASFFAYGPTFTGGIFVAAGDVTGDGRPDLLTGADASVNATGGHVKVFDGVNLTEVRSFFAYDPSFAGGVRVAAGDINGDGRADIITGSGSGAPAEVKVFDALTGLPTRDFLPYGPSFSGGIFVGSGDITGDGLADIITGADTNNLGGHVKVFDGSTGLEVRSFFAFDGFRGGVRVSAGDVNGDGRDDIIVGSGPGTTGHVKVFSGVDNSLLHSYFPYPAFQDGIFVASTPLIPEPTSLLAACGLAFLPLSHRRFRATNPKHR